MTAAGFRRGTPRIDFRTVRCRTQERSGRVVMMTRSGMVSEYYFYCGRARTHLTERRRVLFSWYLYLRSCYASGLPINLIRLTRFGGRHRSLPIGYGQLATAMQTKITTLEIYCLTVNQRGFPEWARGESYTGLMVQDLETIWEGAYKGDEPAYDIMPRHYGACGICREFDDAVCVTAPATVDMS